MDIFRCMDHRILSLGDDWNLIFILKLLRLSVSRNHQQLLFTVGLCLTITINHDIYQTYTMPPTTCIQSEIGDITIAWILILAQLISIPKSHAYQSSIAMEKGQCLWNFGNCIHPKMCQFYNSHTAGYNTVLYNVHVKSWNTSNRSHDSRGSNRLKGLKHSPQISEFLCLGSKCKHISLCYRSPTFPITLDIVSWIASTIQSALIPVCVIKLVPLE